MKKIECEACGEHIPIDETYLTSDLIRLCKKCMAELCAAAKQGAPSEQTGNIAMVQCRSHCPGNPCLINVDWLCRKDACRIERAVYRQ
jgi:hypothetical protein